MLGYLTPPSSTPPHTLPTRRVVGDWLYTGDWGFVDEEGGLYFVSRSSDRINTGGEKVWLCVLVGEWVGEWVGGWMNGCVCVTESVCACVCVCVRVCVRVCGMAYIVPFIIKTFHV